MSRLFVYGTLRSGERQAGLLGDRRRRPARVRGRLYRLDAGYPALVAADGGWVEGELIDDVDDRLLGLLDHYEGVAEGLFRRERVTVTLGLRTERAWTYVMSHPERRGGVLIPSGRWHNLRRR